MRTISNIIGGEAARSASPRTAPVFNPATGEQTAILPLSTAAELDAAVAAAKLALPAWAEMPPLKRARYMFNFKRLLDENVDRLAEAVSAEHGKVHGDAVGEVQRGIEVVDFCCGIPHLLKGEFSRHVGPAIDTHTDRQPLGVCAGITPFNFPAMVPMWMYPVAIACGNTFVLKPSEKDPGVSAVVYELFREAGFPDGVLNIVHGDKEVVDAILTHPDIKAVSFVGSTPIAEYVYRTGTAQRKARAGAGRRQEPHGGDARRRHGQGRRRTDGRRLRLGRRALHGDLGRRAGGRGDRRQAGRDAGAARARAEDRPGDRPRGRDGPARHQGAPGQGHRLHRPRRQGRRRPRRRWPRLQAAGLRERLLRRRHAVRPRHDRDAHLQGRDLRARPVGGARGDATTTPSS